jgi:hypothetical protein
MSDMKLKLELELQLAKNPKKEPVMVIQSLALFYLFISCRA